MSSTYKRAVGASLFLGFAWMVAYYFLAMPTVRPHSGDGCFENHSWRFPWPYLGIPIPGYTIDFPQFDLSNDFEASYHLEDLPAIHNPVGVYLSLHDPNNLWSNDGLRKKLIATIQFDIYDDGGRSVCHVEQPLAKMWWAWPEGGNHCFGLYVSDESFFVPNSGARYTLCVRYSPDPALRGFKGFVHIRCGGSI